MKIQITRYDKEWSKLVRDRDEYRCQVCGKQSKYMNAHHFIRRAILSTRLDINNGISLCAQCHTFNSSFSAHQTPAEFKKWFKRKWATRARTLELKTRESWNNRKAILTFLKDNRNELSTPQLKNEYKKYFIETETTI